MVIFKERGWRCERAIPTDFLLSQKQLSGRQEHRHKQATGNRLIEACPDRNFQSDLQICFLHLFVIFGKATLPGLLVQRRQIVPSLFHYSHHLVERYTMIPIGKSRIDISIQSPRRSIGIPFDTKVSAPIRTPDRKSYPNDVPAPFRRHTRFVRDYLRTTGWLPPKP